MAEFGAREIAEFLRLLDGELETSSQRVTLIGGAAITLVYVQGGSTRDVDLVPVGSEVFWAAVERARRRMDPPISVQSAGIFQPPYDYEERCIRVDVPGTTRLVVLVPERHDLALMKVARGATPDIDAIERMHRAESFRLETLIERFHATGGQLIGSPTELELNFLAAVERLFGEAEAGRVSKRLESEKGPPILP